MYWRESNACQIRVVRLASRPRPVKEHVVTFIRLWWKKLRLHTKAAFAAVAVRRGDHDRALEILNRVLDEDPQQNVYYGMRGLVWAAKGT